MEQNLVPYQSSTAGNHRSNGLRFKKGLQLAMVLAVCIWLLCQIKESSNHDTHRPNQLKEHGTMLLGRKWKVGLMDGGDPEFESGNWLREVEGKEDGGFEDGSDQSEMGAGGVHGFRDENGVPPDGFELVKSTPYERRQYDQSQASGYYSGMFLNDKEDRTED